MGPHIIHVRVLGGLSRMCWYYCMFRALLYIVDERLSGFIYSLKCFFLNHAEIESPCSTLLNWNATPPTLQSVSECVWLDVSAMTHALQASRLQGSISFLPTPFVSLSLRLSKDACLFFL